MSATFIPFVEGHSFNPDLVRIMGDAYDMACKSLHDKGQPSIVREVIAKHVIDIAGTGELGAAAICERVLATLGAARSGRSCRRPRLYPPASGNGLR